MKDVTFRAHDIPLIFTPRLVWPTKSDRSRGFLIPRVMFSSTYGDRLELGYFVPFGESTDGHASHTHPHPNEPAEGR